VLPSTKALLAFAGRFLLVFCLALLLWFALTPAYNRLLASGATIVLSFTESRPLPTLTGRGNDILLMRDDPLSKDGRRVQGFKGNLTHFNFILMVALIFSPRWMHWRSRSVMLAIALGALFVTHLAYLLIGVKFFQQPELEAFQGPGGRLSVWGVKFYLSMASQLLPVVIWMALYRWVAKESVFDTGEDPAGAQGKQQRVERVGHGRGKI
jgi:hypothetical protein